MNSKKIVPEIKLFIDYIQEMISEKKFETVDNIKDRIYRSYAY